MLDRVNIQNFKSISSQNLTKLPKIVGIWGENGTGKSNLLQAIYWTARNVSHSEAPLFAHSPSDLIFKRNERQVLKVMLDPEAQNKCTRQYLHVGGYSYPHRPRKEIRYFPTWRATNTPTGQTTQHVEHDIGINPGSIHSFTHWFFHKLILKQRGSDPEAEHTINRVQYWCEKVGLGQLFDDQVSENTVSASFSDPDIGVDLPLVLGGYGGNSFISILLESMSFKNGTLLIEEPEISLHPAAQDELWDFFLELVDERGHQIIFTSHSAHLSKRLARSLQKDRKDIRCYLTTKNIDSGTVFTEKSKEELIENLKTAVGRSPITELHVRQDEKP